MLPLQGLDTGQVPTVVVREKSRVLLVHPALGLVSSPEGGEGGGKESRKQKEREMKRKEEGNLSGTVEIFSCYRPE